LSVIVSSVFAEGMKIGYVNSEQILSEYKEAVDAMAKLETESKKMQEEFKAMQQKGQELLAEYEKRNLFLPIHGKELNRRKLRNYN